MQVRGDGMSKRILILGGTGDARKLAARLIDDDHRVVSSLAGATANPLLPPGEVRVGGFGGANGLMEYAKSEQIDMIVDATHPFAVQISENAVMASRSSGIAYARLERPPWKPRKGDLWITTRDTDDAVGLIEPGACAFVTIGRKEIAKFAERKDIRVVARMIEPPDSNVSDDWRIILARPPFALDDELTLMRDEGVTVLVSKNAGGPGRAKLDAAKALGLPVIMIERPDKPAASVLTTIEQVAAIVAGGEK